MKIFSYFVQFLAFFIWVVILGHFSFISETFDQMIQKYDKTKRIAIIRALKRLNLQYRPKRTPKDQKWDWNKTLENFTKNNC